MDSKPDGIHYAPACLTIIGCAVLSRNRAGTGMGAHVAGGYSCSMARAESFRRDRLSLCAAAAYALGALNEWSYSRTVLPTLAGRIHFDLLGLRVRCRSFAFPRRFPEESFGKPR